MIHVARLPAAALKCFASPYLYPCHNMGSAPSLFIHVFSFYVPSLLMDSLHAYRGAHFELVGQDFTIRSLVKDGPAQRMGVMKEGDRLISVDGFRAQGKLDMLRVAVTYTTCA